METINLPLNAITRYSKNPRKNDGAVAKVAASIREFGFNQPIVVDRKHVIIAGDTRYLAAIQLGLLEVPVYVAGKLSASQVKAYRIADNRTHEEAVWDERLLKYELKSLQEIGYDLHMTGFNDDELEKLLKDLTEESQPVEKDYEAKFEVVVACADENDQEAVYRLLTAKGYPCRVLSI